MKLKDYAKKSAANKLKVLCLVFFQDPAREIGNVVKTKEGGVLSLDSNLGVQCGLGKTI